MNALPSKIVCVGRNYRAHAKELGNDVPAEPLLFFKPPSSIIADGETIVLPKISKQVEFEGEIGLIVGRRLKNARENDLKGALRAVVAINDVTARDLQKSDGQWTRAKGFDTFCAVGPEAPPPTDPASLGVITRVNGEERQRASANDMVFSISVLLTYISSIMTLEPGDLIATGTPAGVGPLRDGDVVEIDIGVSRVSNPVRAER